MSLRRQLQYKYHNFTTSVRTMALPQWMTARATRALLLVAVLFFGIAYIVTITKSATSGYRVITLEKQTQALAMEVQKLQVEIADGSSITTLASRIANLNMVEAAGVKHLGVKSNTVAKN